MGVCFYVCLNVGLAVCLAAGFEFCLKVFFESLFWVCLVVWESVWMFFRGLICMFVCVFVYALIKGLFAFVLGLI